MEKMNVTASFEGDRQVQLRSMATEPRWSTISKEAKISSCPRAPGKALITREERGEATVARRWQEA